MTSPTKIGLRNVKTRLFFADSALAPWLTAITIPAFVWTAQTGAGEKPPIPKTRQQKNTQGHIARIDKVEKNIHISVSGDNRLTMEYVSEYCI